MSPVLTLQSVVTELRLPKVSGLGWGGGEANVLDYPDGPGTATYTVMWYVYQNVFNNGSIGYAAAMGVIMLLITLVIALFYMRGTRSEVAGE
jgi:ABC-type sugar transport system permease subunit